MLKTLGALWLAGAALAAGSAPAKHQAPRAPQAAPSGRLVVCDDVEDPLTLDPHKEFSEKNHTLLQQMYEGLVRFTPEGKVEPALAVSWARLDPLRMRFNLRQGVRFHNGELFDAEAVRFSIKRYLDPATGFPALAFISSIDRAEVVDPSIVDIVTKYPDGLLLNRLAGFIVIVPPRHVQEGGERALEERPVGTGAFRFGHWQKGEEVRLDANGEYWSPGQPKVENLVFRFLPWERQVGELLAGRVDILTELPGTRTMEVARSTNARVDKQVAFYAMVGPMNVSRGPLADRRVRRALNYALNREDLLRYDILGNGRLLAGLTLPGEEGHDPRLKPYPYEPDRARALLKDAGHGDGLELRALVKEQGLRTMGVIQEQLEQVGVRLSIESTTDQRIILDIAKGEWDLLFGGCPDPMAHSYFIQSVILYSKSPYSIVKDPVYDRMLEEMASTLDAKEREKKARRLDRYVFEEALSLFTYQRIKTYGVNRKVSFSPWVTGMPYFYEAENPGTSTTLEAGGR